MAYLSAFARASGITTPASKDRTPSSIDSTSTPEPEHPLDRRTMSLIKRTQQWLEGPTPKKDSNTVNLHKVKGSRITKSPSKKEKRKSFWSLELLSSFFGKEQKEETTDDLEGETYVEDDEPLPTIEHDHDFTLVEDYEDEDKAANTKRALKDVNDRYLDYTDPRIKEWTNEEIWLFNKLQKRGAEPLLISTWTRDFSTFPDQLFSQDENQVFINNIHTSSGHGRQLALPSLLKISANLFCFQLPPHLQNSSRPAPTLTARRSNLKDRSSANSTLTTNGPSRTANCITKNISPTSPLPLQSLEKQSKVLSAALPISCTHSDVNTARNGATLNLVRMITTKSFYVICPRSLAL